MPFKNYRISQEYGRKNAMYRKGYHTGIDLVAIGDTTVYSVGTGQVIQARYAPGKGADPQGWGNYVIVRLDDGHDVLYAHLSQVSVKTGQKVARGDKVGIQGSTGNSTGPHLHFEVWRGNWQNRNDIDPNRYLAKDVDIQPAKVIVNGQACEAYIIDGKTFVEVRKPFELAGFKVHYNSATKATEIVK